MTTVTVRCSPAARDRLVALASESRRSVAGVLEILSTATVRDMLDLVASALAPGLSEETGALLTRREPDEEAEE